MSSSLVQTTGVQSVGVVASLAKAFASNVTIHNLIAVAVSSYPSSGGTPPTHTVADTLTHTYSSAIRLTGAPTDTAAAHQQFYTPNTSAGANTVTVTHVSPGTESFITLAIAEIHGCVFTSPVHVTDSGTGTSTGPTSGNFTTTLTSFLWASMLHIGPDMTITSGSPWNFAFEAEDGDNMPLGAEYRSAEPAGTYAATWTIGISTPWTVLVTAFTDDVTGPIISDVAVSNITRNEATVTWTTDEISDSQVEYGTTVAYGSETTLDPTLVTSHSVDLTGLIAGATYHFRVKSRDVAGNLSVSADGTFTTTPGPGAGAAFSTQGRRRRGL